MRLVIVSSGSKPPKVLHPVDLHTLDWEPDGGVAIWFESNNRTYAVSMSAQEYLGLAASVAVPRRPGDPEPDAFKWLDDLCEPCCKGGGATCQHDLDLLETAGMGTD